MSRDKGKGIEVMVETDTNQRADNNSVRRVFFMRHSA